MMYKIILMCLLLVGCHTQYVQPIYQPLTYEHKSLDLSPYKDIALKQNNNDICLTDDNYQLIVLLLTDLKNYIDYQQTVIKSLDAYQQEIYQKSLKK